MVLYVIMGGSSSSWGYQLVMGLPLWLPGCFISCKIPLKWMRTGDTLISGNHHIYNQSIYSMYSIYIYILYIYICLVYYTYRKYILYFYTYRIFDIYIYICFIYIYTYRICAIYIYIDAMIVNKIFWCHKRWKHVYIYIYIHIYG